MSNKYTGKTAIISGGAGGIGFALAQEFGSLGMKIVIADIDKQQLDVAKESLQQAGIQTLACQLDVTDEAQWQQTVEAAEKEFGNIHMLVNNAGVGGIPGSIEETKLATWKWVLDVNLFGVVNGTQVAGSAIKRHGEGGWIINVASMAGMNGVAFSGPYAASKAAVVSMSESWAAELKPHNIAVSVLCPAFVKTRIHESMRNVQPKHKEVMQQLPTKAAKDKGMNKAAELVNGGIPPQVLAKRVVEALNSGQAYIFTHPNYRPATAYRSNLLDEAYADAEISPLVGNLKNEPLDIL